MITAYERWDAHGASGSYDNRAVPCMLIRALNTKHSLFLSLLFSYERV